MYLSPVATNNSRSRSPYRPTQAWTARVPSPPRILVPPPPMSDSGMPDLKLDVRLDFETSGFANVDFLKSVTYGNHNNGNNNILHWQYSQRRRAQQILPFLFLGPVSAARDRDFLQQEGITMVLAVRDTKSAHAQLLGSKAATELGITSKSIDVAGNQELIAAFPRSMEVINTHLSIMFRQQQQNSNNLQQESLRLPGKVLVFCESGNERSAAVIAAYIMATYSVDLITTIQIIQSKRFCTSFDDSLKVLLKSYEAILKAKRDVATFDSVESAVAAVGDGRPAAKRSTKRTIHEACEMDVEADEAYGPMDEERFGQRSGAAPFLDELTY